MTAVKTNKEVLLALEEVGDLLNEEDWTPAQGIYLEGERVCLLLNPYPAEDTNYFHLPITILPLTDHVEQMQIGTIILYENKNGYAHYGRLNARGQILFKSMQDSVYQTRVSTLRDNLFTSGTWWRSLSENVANNIQRTIQEVLVPIPSSLLTAAMEIVCRGNGEEFICTSADHSLSIVLRERSKGALSLEFETPDRSWDGAIVAFGWTSSHTEETLPVESELRFAVMNWNESHQACSTAVNLDTLLLERDLFLPTQPWPLDMLYSELSQPLQASIASIGTNSARQAWRELVTSGTLTQGVQDILLDTLGSTPASFWQKTLTSTMLLFTQLRIVVSEKAAVFDQLPSPLTPQWVPMAMTRSATESSEHDKTAQRLELPAPEEDTSVELTVQHSSSNQTMLRVRVTQMSSGQPVSRERVTLRDKGGRIVSSERTQVDGTVTFFDIQPGDYMMEAKHQHKTWKLPINIKYEDDITL